MSNNFKIVTIIVLAVIIMNLITPILAETVIIRPTKVKLTLDETINTKTSQQGDPVKFTVVSPVYQDGKMIINGGASAQGKIDILERSGALGKPATIAISLTNVQAVDGSQIPIIANKTLKGDSRVTEAIVVSLVLCIFGLFIKGDNVTMQAGYTVDADVLGGSSVNLPDN